ncbi:MAG: sodium/proline symporter PutP [Clostridiales bacterium]|nr:sodium/proline symporter PutP [Clostridiales bacterium]
MGEKLDILIAMAGYMLIVILIGVFFAKRSQASTENYFLGGRSLGPWVAAMSAEASDMSGWLLMGLPGVAYWCGLADAAWTAIGLALGTYINWLLVSRRLRSYSIVSGDSITVPDFLSNRFHEKKKVILGVSAIFILIFFTVYAASCFVTCGKLFAGLFDLPYHAMMLTGAAFVLIYTILGGFLAESASDFMQAIVMILALLGVLIFGVNHAGGIGAVIDNAKDIPGFLSLTSIASPIVDANGVQQTANGIAQFGQAGSYGWITILSTLSWGLGYFGVPQVLLRFMAIRKGSELNRSRRIATVWCVISLVAAVSIGILGRKIFPFDAALATKSTSENIFAQLSQLLFHPVVAGIIMAGILAATISSSDSYLLIAASAVSKNIYEGIVKKDASDKQVMRVSRIVLLIVALIGILIAWDEKSIIFEVVSFAWAGFGATFGPIILFSLFWKRTNRAGAIAGMISGGAMVFFWKLVLKPIGGVFGIYELLPAFLVSCIVIAVVSLSTAKPSAEIEEEFERARTYQDAPQEPVQMNTAEEV